MRDPPLNTAATSVLLLENERTRVTEWKFANRGDNTGWHRHEFDYMVIPLFGGDLDILLPGGATIVTSVRDRVPYFRKAGVEHDVRNGNNFACAFIEVEFLK